MRLLRYQPPARSPLPLGAWVGASLQSTPGPDPVATLAERLRADFQAGEALLLDSGTHALQHVLSRVVKDRPGPILLPAYSCYDIATAAVGARAQVRLYDLDPATFAPDLDSVEEGLKAGCRVVVAGPLYGLPLPWSELAELARRHGAIVVEDAAQGQGARSPEGPCGSLGHASILSFGRGKGWTGGGGGALLLRGDSLDPGGVDAHPPGGLPIAVKSLVQWGLARPSLYWIPASLPFLGLGETHYKEPSPPRPMAPWSAALALATEEASRAEARSRASTGEALLRRLDEARLTGIQLPTVLEGSGPGFLRFPLRLRGGWPALADPGRARRAGLAPGYPRALCDLEPMVERMADRTGDFPGARELAASVVTLPTHTGTSQRDRDDLIALLQEESASLPR